MAIEIIIPRLGWSMDEGTFGEWLKGNGEFVEAGEPIFALESEKALQEVESIDAGILFIVPGGPSEGDTVCVGLLIAYLLADGEEPPVARTAGDRETVRPQHAPLLAAKDIAPQNPIEPREKRSATGHAPAISPRAARVARDMGIDWSRIQGTGRLGRIRERDVRTAASEVAASKRSAPAGRVRDTIAARMLAGVRTTAPVTLTTCADARNLVAVRDRLKTDSGDGPIPAYHDVIAVIAARALTEHPVMNSQWTDNGVIQPEGVHIGIAVDTEAGLLVPVVRDADRLSLHEFSGRSRKLIERARERKCSPDELSGGTFTITSLGSFGVDAFTPIINTPETAILGLGAIRRAAVVTEDGRIEAREQMTLSLTFDHRVADGAPAARFLQCIAEGIKNVSSRSCE